MEKHRYFLEKESQETSIGCGNLIGAIMLGIVIIALILFSSCSPQKRLTRICENNTVLCNNSDTIVEKEVEFIRHDSIVYTPPDSTIIKAYMRCDSSGRARLQILNKVLGERSNVRIITKYDTILQDSIILIQGDCSALIDSLTWYQQRVKLLTTVNTTHQTECPKCFLTVKKAIIYGIISLIIIVLLVFLRYIFSAKRLNRML